MPEKDLRSSWTEWTTMVWVIAVFLFGMSEAIILSSDYDRSAVGQQHQHISNHSSSFMGCGRDKNIGLSLVLYSSPRLYFLCDDYFVCNTAVRLLKIAFLSTC
jgi:hypothetical protein